MIPLHCIRMFSYFHFCCTIFVYWVVNCFNNKVRKVGLYVFKILNDHFQLPNGEDVLQSIKDDKEKKIKNT